MKLMGFERRWARAVCETIYPGGDLPLGVGGMDVEGYFDELMANVPFEPAIGLRLAFWLLAFAPLFVIGRFALFADLKPEDRERVLKSIATSNVYALRGTVIAIKAVLSLFYCGDPRVRPAIWAVPERPPALVALKTKKTDAPAAATSGAEHEHHFA
jgi:hypothetical protein